MRTYVLALATGGLFAFPLAAWSQEVDVGPRGVQTEPDHHGRSAWRPDCREMRKACLNKEELGEQGRGNCQRYRHFCGGE